MHGDLTQRAVVATDSVPWIVVAAGVEEKLLEATGARRTALVRVQPGATLPAHTDAFVLETGLYLANAPLAGPCIAFVKQRPARDATPRSIETRRLRFQRSSTGILQATIRNDADAHVVLLHFEPGMAIGTHEHDDGEEFFVLVGELRDEHGAYGEGTWVRQPAASVHAVESPRGCTLLTFAHHLRRA
jgi:anti-sigma factor ChrR (cupin superfamily)